MMKLRSAIDSGRDYELPERHDPLYLMFDNDFLLGECLMLLTLCYFNDVQCVIFVLFECEPTNNTV